MRTSSSGFHSPRQAGFAAAPNPGKKDDFLGEPKAVFVAADSDSTAGALLIHEMPIPAGLDYTTLKSALGEFLKGAFGDSDKLVKQEDLKVDGLTGFLLEFECASDGKKPTPGGSDKHHVRWYLIREGDSKLAGLLYGSRQAAWKDLDAKFSDSAKSLAKAGG